jgi:hypothetical protein
MKNINTPSLSELHQTACSLELAACSLNLPAGRQGLHSTLAANENTLHRVAPPQLAAVACSLSRNSKLVARN